MRYEFTPAAQRAIAFAVRSSGDQRDLMEEPALLLGLLAESECRAALMLARCGVTAETIRRQWPNLVQDVPPNSARPPRDVRLSGEVESSLGLVCERLAEYPRPLLLATEHLLLALVSADHEVARWLRGQGLDAGAVEAEIHRVYGYQAGPLAIDEGQGAGGEGRGATDVEKGSGSGGACPASPASGGIVHETTPISVLRILDAAGNRAREALRTIEDFVRFVLDDAHLTGLCKHLRHDLVAALGRIPAEHLLAARETQADVGTRLSAAGEQSRDDAAAVLTANLARLQEALRSLEEFGKLVHDREEMGTGSEAVQQNTGTTSAAELPVPVCSLGAEMKALRYRSYTLQRAVEITRFSLERLAGARLCVLIDGRSSSADFERLARGLIEAGVHIIQLRDKRLDDRQLLERARLLRQLTRGTETLFIMNDRTDLALLSQADGVHLGQEDLSVKDARTVLGPEALIGVSTHSIDQARQAVLDGANYLGVGPVFPSETKHFEHFPGLDLLRAVACEIRLPAFAIGGISPENLPEVLSTGVSRVAVSGAITAAKEPAAAARNLITALAETHHGDTEDTEKKR